jgi:hypothetical protein
VVVNSYNYELKGMWFYLVLGVLASIGTVILLVYLVVILISYLDKRKVIRSFQK